jgi:hypothetical protein
MHHWLPVSTHPSEAKDNKMCFWCDNVQEDQYHRYKCPCEDATKLQAYRTETTKFFNKSKLHHTIQNIIIGQLYECQSTPTINLIRVHNKQNQIGWETFNDDPYHKIG